MKRFILFVAVYFCATAVSFAADKPVKVSALYVYLSNDRNESQAQAEALAIQYAKQKALEDKFGVDVSSIVVVMQSENQHKGEFQSQEDFFSLGGTQSRGEWIKTTKEEILSATHNGETWVIRAFVEGLARAKNENPIDLRYQLTNRVDGNRAMRDFQNGDDLFLRFSSPVSGALCVYLVDEDKKVSCLLPYDNNELGYQPIQANKEYLFFKESENDPYAQEITLVTPNEKVGNVLYIVFTPNRITKAHDQKGERNWQGQETPRYLAYKDFLDWLSQYQIRDEQLVVRTELITIHP